METKVAFISSNGSSRIGKKVEYLYSVNRRGLLSEGNDYTGACDGPIEKVKGSSQGLIAKSCKVTPKMAAIYCGLGLEGESIPFPFTCVSRANVVVLCGRPAPSIEKMTFDKRLDWMKTT